MRSLLIIISFYAVCALTAGQRWIPDDRYTQDLKSITYTSVIPGMDKRSTLILDKLMYALQKALRQPDESNAIANSVDLQKELQRRGPGGRIYWRCYFNAVSCFRRK